MSDDICLDVESVVQQEDIESLSKLDGRFLGLASLGKSRGIHWRRQIRRWNAFDGTLRTTPT